MKEKEKMIAYALELQVRLLVPFTPDDQGRVDVGNVMSKSEGGHIVHFNHHLEHLLEESIQFGIEYDELTGIGTQVEAGTVRCHIIDMQVMEKDSPVVQNILDTSTINPVKSSKSIN